MIEANCAFKYTAMANGKQYVVGRGGTEGGGTVRLKTAITVLFTRYIIRVHRSGVERRRFWRIYKTRRIYAAHVRERFLSRYDNAKDCSHINCIPANGTRIFK